MLRENSGCCGRWAAPGCAGTVNAAAESFWSIFKNEYYHRHVFATIDDARRGAYTWIDGWYNARRRHSGIGYLSPLEYERRQLALAA